MILQYETSDGTIFDLKTGPIRTRTANFHDYSWKPKVVNLQYGDRVTRFDKASVTYTAVLDIDGSLAERRETLNTLHTAFDNDIYKMTPGRIIHGEYYIRCFVTLSSTFYKGPFTQNEINIYCPYPFWIKERQYEFIKPDSSEDANRYLDYASEGALYSVESGYYLDFVQGHLDEDGVVHLPIVATEVIPQSANLGFEGNGEFPYDYMCINSGQQTITNAGTRGADYRLIVFGAISNPCVIIDNIIIGVNASIAEDEYLVIDSHDKTVIKYGNSGERTNLFNARYKEQSIFGRIGPGVHDVIWPGTFGFNLIVYEERSEPLWI